jgi:thiol:disulfide interchange protein DsbD
LALVLWALQQQGKAGWLLRALALVLLAVALWQWGASWTRTEPTGQKDSTASGASSPQNKGVPGAIWEAWSEEKVAKARDAGQPVFIDFTAAWCVTCQFNKKTTFSQAEVVASFAQKNVLLLRADWTRYDPAITQALNALGRNGVPVYAWYAPGQSVQLLSELPSVTEIQNALRQVKAAPSTQ